MEIIKTKDVETKDALPGLVRRVLAHNPKIMLVEHWHKEATSFPWHDHFHEQLAYVLKGKLIVETEMGSSTVETGDSFIIPGGIKHRVISIEESIVLDFFSPRREDYL